MDRASNSSHQILDRVRPVIRTQRVGKLLQTNLPYFREPGFVALR